MQRDPVARRDVANVNVNSAWKTVTVISLLYIHVFTSMCFPWLDNRTVARVDIKSVRGKKRRKQGATSVAPKGGEQWDFC